MRGEAGGARMGARIGLMRRDGGGLSGPWRPLLLLGFVHHQGFSHHGRGPPGFSAGPVEWRRGLRLANIDFSLESSSWSSFF